MALAHPYSSAPLPAPDAAGAPCLPSASAAHTSTWTYATDMQTGQTFASAPPGDFEHIMARAADYFEVEPERIKYVDGDQFTGEYGEFLTIDGKPVARVR